MIKIAVFASGNGTNALNLYHFFKDHPTILTDQIYCNNPNAGIIQRSREKNIPCRIFTKPEWLGETIRSELQERGTDFIILAGFLWLVPPSLTDTYNKKIINIHPALLPRFGGHGMYGIKVHESVIAAHQRKSGITIHLVNDKYDEGEILFQKTITIEPQETPDSLASKIHDLEYEYFPVVVENYITEYTKKGR